MNASGLVRQGVGTRRGIPVRFALVGLPLLMFAAAGSFTAQARSKRPKPQPCPDQSYLVQGAPVLPGSTTPEAIVVSGKQISLGAACAPTAAKLSVKRRGTTVKATWPSCTGIVGKLKLAAKIDPACETMSGTVKARQPKLKKRFDARHAVCGGGLQCNTVTAITVNTTTDALGDGLCSFREAVRAANTSAAVDACPAGTAGTTNTIAFNIPGPGVHTITAPSVIDVTGSLAIDGSTQPGYAGVPLIHITGVVEDLLVFRDDAHGSSVKALMFTNTNGGGLIDGAGILFGSDNNTITASYFNTDGVKSIGDYGAGLLFAITSTNNVIGGSTAATRNVFGGRTGVYFQDSSHNLVEGNYFGVQPDGNTAITGLPVSGSGVQIYNVDGDTTDVTVRGNVITGFLAGVQINQGAHGNTVQGNHIGVGADGSTSHGNGIGVFVYGASNNTIGGATAADRNVISGNTSTNVTLQTDGQQKSNDNVIQGNYIGPDANGRNSVTPNALFGVYVIGGASGNTLSGNVIAGNQQGVYIDATSAVASDSSQNCIAGNVIYGVNNENAVSAPFANNWWGDAAGPRYMGQAAGGGDWVSANVTIAPFLTSKPATCPGG